MNVILDMDYPEIFNYKVPKAEWIKFYAKFFTERYA
jgi:hypothetical protein